MNRIWPGTTLPVKPISVIALLLLCFSAYYPFLACYCDFRAFYCSGEAILAHVDPYREHPLAECEHAVWAPGASPLANDVTLPSPFPGYAMALFAGFASLPFASACLVWLCLSLAALAFAVVLTARLVRVPVAVAAIVIGFPDFIHAIQLGQVTPFVALAMIGAATFLAAGKPRAAALAALIIALEPHVALPIFVALFIGAPQARFPLVLGTLALGALSIAVLGIALNVEYIRDVLPAHALANIPELSQYSTANIAFSLGAPLTVARTIGGIWYAVASAVGIGAALLLRPRVGAAGLVLLPPAFALFGGLHVHNTQLILAMPAFLLVFANATRGRTVMAAAIFVAATPWINVSGNPSLIPAAIVLAYCFAQTAGIKRAAVSFACAIGIMASVLFQTSYIGVAQHVRPRLVVRATGNPLAEVSWGVAMRQREGFAGVPWFIAAKVPTFLAFLILLSALVAAAAREFPPARRRLAVPTLAVKGLQVMTLPNDP